MAEQRYRMVPDSKKQYGTIITIRYGICWFVLFRSQTIPDTASVAIFVCQNTSIAATLTFLPLCPIRRSTKKEHDSAWHYFAEALRLSDSCLAPMVIMLWASNWTSVQHQSSQGTIQLAMTLYSIFKHSTHSDASNRKDSGIWCCRASSESIFSSSSPIHWLYRPSSAARSTFVLPCNRVSTRLLKLMLSMIERAVCWISCLCPDTSLGQVRLLKSPKT